MEDQAPHPDLLRSTASREGPAHLGVWAVAVSLALSIWAGVEIGSLHPDEVFQFLEPANHLAFGFGWMSWEWTEGIRNWVVPGTLAVGMRLIHQLGWTTPWGHRFGASLMVALWAYPGMVAIPRYASRRLGPGSPSNGSILALLLVVLWGPSFLFLGRTMGESMGALMGMAAIEALDRPGGRARDAILAGTWLGLAVVVRYPFAVLVVALLVQLLAERRARDFLLTCLGGLPVAAALGALDWATWGAPFHSMISYVAFNIGSDAADRFGRQPWWYFIMVIGWLPWPLILGLPSLDLRRARALFPSAVYLLALMITPHKEGRFLYPVILWTSADLAPSFVSSAAALWSSGWGGRRLVRFGVLLFTCAGAGAYYFMVDLDADIFRATIRAGGDPKLTGLLIAGPMGRWGSGGDFYLGRDLDVQFGIPGEDEFNQALENPKVNRAIVPHDVDRAALQDAGFKVVDELGFGRTAIMAR